MKTNAPNYIPKTLIDYVGMVSKDKGIKPVEVLDKLDIDPICVVGYNLKNVEDEFINACGNYEHILEINSASKKVFFGLTTMHKKEAIGVSSKYSPQ